jgi:predicted MPP superfamily phosphohydrolase
LRQLLAAALGLGLLGWVPARAEEVLLRGDAPPLLACGAVDGDWTHLESDERGFSLRLPVPDAGTGCARTQLLRWRFTLAKAIEHQVITLRARYQHGFVAYLDGAEVARRRLPPNATLETPALDVHGPEWERIPLPLRTLAAGPHELAVEVHPHTAGREPFLDAELSVAAAPSLTAGPYLVETTTRSATIALETDVPTTASLRWGAGDELDQAVPDRDGAAPSRRHLFVIDGLRAATRYAYAVQVRAPQLPDAEVDTGPLDFHTPPEPGRPLRFVIYGDVRSGHDVHADLVRAIRAEDPDLAIMTGDLVDMGSDEADWTRYFEIATPLLEHVAVYPAPGNHEYARAGRGAARFRELFRPLESSPTGWRSFDVAGVHFIALDSSQYHELEQLAWLRRDLEHAHHARAIFAYAHEGAFSAGLHGDNEIAKTQYAPLLEHAGATLYIAGHDHHYERGRVGKLDYLISGGGGAELRAQRCGVPGRKPCPPRVLAIANEHNYVVVEVLPRLLRVCAKRPDGTPIEPCVTRPLPR